MTITTLSQAAYPSLTGLTALVCIAFCALSSKPALACHTTQNIRLLEPVTFTAQQLADFHAMPTLRVRAVNAPPMARYHEDHQIYDGIGVDVLCFITNELGLRYEIDVDRQQTVKDKIQQVQDGRADVFMPLSHTPEREKHGLFTIPYYESYYAVIARQGAPISIRSINDLAKYNVGVVQGVSLEPKLKTIVPAPQLHSYNIQTSDVLFHAVSEGTIDLAVFNQNIFNEKRYNEELFDLEVIHSLRDDPRAYRYYFSQTPEHERVVQAFDRYLAVIDVSESVSAHEGGEREFLERYVAQRNQRYLLQTASVAAALLALVFYLAFLRYRRLTTLLADRNAHIQQQQHALQEAYSKLETLSQTDSLTGLSNRRHFDQMLSYEYARNRRTGSPLSLILVDVDHFKSVNDHYGHNTGDDYLCAIARALESNVTRSTDLVARYGGDEFICLLPGVSPENAVKVAERILDDVAKLNLPNVWASPPQLTLTIGVATVVNGDPGIDGLVAHADAQLYIAKKLGRNRVSSTVV